MVFHLILLSSSDLDVSMGREKTSGAILCPEPPPSMLEVSGGGGVPLPEDESKCC